MTVSLRAALLGGAILLGGCSSGRMTAPECPTVEELRAYRPPEASRIFAADGSVVADLSPQRRVVIPLSEMPALLRDGVVAVEDRRFWRHRGVDVRGLGRAAWRNVRTLSLREGFSTITMQIPRNVFPEELHRAEKLKRKACEVRLAARIERAFGKREILALYLNTINLANGFYGVEAASRGYFGKPASALDPAEAALLIAVLNSPTRFNPRSQPEQALRRRNTVLAVMAREGVIPPAEAEHARAQPLRLVAPAEVAGPAPYYVAAVRRELRARFGDDADVLGLRVHTGLVPALQQASATALRRQIERIESGAWGVYRHPTPAGADGSAADVLQGMVIVLDARDGSVQALVGGRDFGISQFDRAFQARRQPGSAFKPLVYATALQRGLTLSTPVETTPLEVRTVGSPGWRPDDMVHDSVRVLPARTALALSSNHAAVRVGQWAGVDEVIHTARRLGLRTPIPPYPSIFLGAAEVVPAELVAAYAAFANGGFRVEPRLISRVEDPRGRVLWQAPAGRERALDEGVAFLTLSMLEEAVDGGTGAAVRREGFWLPAAGKTGTTNDAKDAWFIGMTPELVAGVWLGFDRPRRIQAGASGGRFAAPVWARIMTAAYEARPAPGAFVAPPGVRAIAVDAVSGHVATSSCPAENIRVEYFLPGTEPAALCPLHPDAVHDRLLERLRRRFRQVF
jgi:penicillin-binding protein 1A